MKKAFFFLLTVLIGAALLSGCGGNKAQTDLNKLLAEKWHSYAAARPNWGGGLALYIISPKGYFYASTALPGGTANTRFRAASTTKTYTAAAIMLLHQQGKLNINDPITAKIPGINQPYVPDTPEYNIPNKDKITIKLLLGHRAGVFDLGNSLIPPSAKAPYAGQDYAGYVMAKDSQHTFTFDELVGVVAKHKLSYFAPDTSYKYSNTGYSTLGKIIERVSGKNYAQFMKDNFLRPNGLDKTSFPYLGNDNNVPAPYETGYAYQAQKLTEVTNDNMSANVAEGNLITTPAELAKWIRALIEGRSGLSTKTVKLMTANTDGGKYGLGIFNVPGIGYGHNGAHSGYMTTAFCDPRQDVTVVISASCLNWDDIASEMKLLYETSRAAKNILGYSTAEGY